MNEVSLLESLGQVSASETGKIFRDFLRDHVRVMICEVKFTKPFPLMLAKQAVDAMKRKLVTQPRPERLYV